MDKGQVMLAVQGIFEKNGLTPNTDITKIVMMNEIGYIVIITSRVWENEVGEPSEQKRQMEQEIKQKVKVKKVAIV